MVLVEVGASLPKKGILFPERDKQNSRYELNATNTNFSIDEIIYNVYLEYLDMLMT